jgi:hypothetical protein
MNGVLPWLVRWSCPASTRDFFLPWLALVVPVQNIFFLTIYYFNYFIPSPSKLGRQPCWVACLLVCVSVHANRVASSLSKGDIRLQWSSVKNKNTKIKSAVYFCRWNCFCWNRKTLYRPHREEKRLRERREGGGGSRTDATFSDIEKHGLVYFSYFFYAHNDRKLVWSVVTLKRCVDMRWASKFFSQIANPQISTKQS